MLKVKQGNTHTVKLIDRGMGRRNAKVMQVKKKG
jgi:hypothetical protein